MLFLGIFEIEIEISYGPWYAFTFVSSNYMLDDCRACLECKILQMESYEIPNQRTLFPEPAVKEAVRYIETAQ